jgi:hypothetical protein
MPRAYFTPCWKWIDEQKEVSHLVLSNKAVFDPARELYVNRHDTSGLTNEGQNPYASKLPSPPEKAVSPDEIHDQFPATRVNVPILTDRPEHVSVSLSTSLPGFVVLTDHFYPGWQALVDGVPQKIYKANLEARAVYIPAGKHLIEFNFEPDCLRTSALFCTVAGVICLLLIGFALAPLTWRLIKRSAGQDV